jgi:DSF synthase
MAPMNDDVDAVEQRSRREASALALPDYEQLQTSLSEDGRSLWCFLNPSPRPCFTTKMLAEIADVHARLRRHRAQSARAADGCRYFVMPSATPSVYNLGGDLALFTACIPARDRARLRAYAHLCIDCIFGNASHLGQPGFTTISVVRGAALGGGFEAALSCNVVIAERGARLGFPEVMFDLFPGMGAYSLLRRRIAPALAERLIREGRQHDAATLHALGVVDILADEGEGLEAARGYIRAHERSRHGYGAIQQLRDAEDPVTRDELIRITELWVEAALQVTERDLRTMSRLINAQSRLARAPEVA